MSDEFEYLCAGVTDTGRVRKNNEDAILMLHSHRVYCVADGMGGAEGGEIASKHTLQAIQSALEKRSQPLAYRTKIDVIKKAVNDASKWIHSWAGERGIKGTGTTLVAMVLSDDLQSGGTVLHAGDSRLYRFRGTALEQVTKDHSIAAAMEAKGDDDIPSRFRDVITNAVGLKNKVKLEETRIELVLGDVLLLCTDGLTKMLSDQILRNMMSSLLHSDPSQIAQALLNAANAAGGRDNTSVGIVSVCDVGSGSCTAVPDTADTRQASTAAGFETAEGLESPLEKQFSTDDSEIRSIKMTTLGDADTGVEGVKAKELPASRNKWIILVAVVLLLVVSGGTFLISKRGKQDVAGVGLGSKQDAMVSVADHGFSDGVSVSSSDTQENVMRPVMPTDSLAGIKKFAEDTGRWDEAYKALRSSSQLKKEASYKRDLSYVQAWYDEWTNAKQLGFNAQRAYQNMESASGLLYAQLGSGQKPVDEERVAWPADPSLRANEYCRLVYLLHVSLTAKTQHYVNQTTAILRTFQPNPAIKMRSLYWLSGMSFSTESEFCETLSELTEELKEVNGLLQRNKRFPPSISKMENLTSIFASRINPGMDIIYSILWKAVSALSAEGMALQLPDGSMQDEMNEVLRLGKKLIGARKNVWAEKNWYRSLDLVTLEDFFKQVEYLSNSNAGQAELKDLVPANNE